MAENFNEELKYVYSKIFILELIEKSKRCSIEWDQISSTCFQTELVFESITYDVFVNKLEFAIVLDILKNDTRILNSNSNSDSDIAVLYSTIEDTVNADNSIREAVTGFNSLLPCNKNIRKVARGGVVGGGTSLALRVKVAATSGGIKTGGEAFNSAFRPIGGLKAGGTARVRGGVSLVASGGAKLGGRARVTGGEVLYMANPSGTGSLEILNSAGKIKTILTGLTNIDKVAVDYDYGRVFWTQNIDGYNRTSLSSCELDGSDPQIVANIDGGDVNDAIGVEGYGTSSLNIGGIALDRVNQHVYVLVNWGTAWIPALGITPVKRFNILRSEYTFELNNDGDISDFYDGILPDQTTSAFKTDLTFSGGQTEFASKNLYYCDIGSRIEQIIITSSGQVAGQTYYVSGARTVEAGAGLYFGGTNLFGTVGSGSPTYFDASNFSIINDISVMFTLNDGYQYFVSDSGLKKVFRVSSSGAILQQLTFDSVARSGIAAVYSRF